MRDRVSRPQEKASPSAEVAHAKEVARTPGQTLDGETRAAMESRFQHDFGSVRVHHDGTAADSAKALRANAYTIGEHIVFGASRFAPSTPGGRELLAHELTHVVQQRNATSIEPRVSNRGDASEVNARAGHVASAGAVPLVQRDEVAVDFEVVTPEESARLRRQGVQLPQAAALGDPRDHSGYIENNIEQLGYGIYIGGFILYSQGFTQPVLYPEWMIDFTQRQYTPVNHSIYPDYQSAMRAVPMGPWQENQAIPFAYFRAANGAIFPTVLSRSNAPRTIESMVATRRELFTQIEHDLAVVALSILGGMALRAVLNRLFRVRSSAGTTNLRPAGATHDLEYTTSRHTVNGRIVQRDLARGREAHVFDEGVDLAALEQRVWTQGRRAPSPAGGGQRAAWDRYVYESPTPIGRRVQTGRPDVPLRTVEIKYDPATRRYHMVPRTRPAE